jgi:hypothetical protein
VADLVAGKTASRELLPRLVELREAGLAPARQLRLGEARGERQEAEAPLALEFEPEEE